MNRWSLWSLNRHGKEKGILTALGEFGIKEITKLHLTKVMLRVLMNRMRNKILPEISETQFGFMTDKGTRNAIFSLRTLMERAIEVQNDLYLCFIDYAEAFDKTF